MIYLGTIDAVTGTRAFVRVPGRSGPHVYGPCRVAEGPWTAGAATAPAGDPAHAHDPGVDLAAGDEVAVAFPADGGAPIVLARLAP